MKQERAKWRWFFSALLASAVILFSLLFYGFGADQGLYSYGAWLWRKFSQVPYVGIFDHNFPGIFLVCYFIQAVLGESVTAFRAFDLVWQIGTGLTIYQLGVSFSRNCRASFLATIFYSLFYLKLGPWDSGQRDGFLLLPYLLSFWLISGIRKGQRNFLRIITAGLLMGFALLIKPVALIIALILMGMIWKSQTRSRLIQVFCFGLLLILDFGLILFYYWQIGHLQELYQSLFVFSQIYVSALFIPAPVRIARAMMLETFLRNPLILVGLLLYLFGQFRSRVRGESWPLDWRFKIFGLGIYLSYLLQGKFFQYHQIPVLGILSLFAGMGYAQVFRIIEERWKFSQGLAISVMVALLFLEPLVIVPDIPQFLLKAIRLNPSQAHQLYPFHRVCSRTADYLKARTQPKDRVQVWGGEALINFLAQRRASTRFASTLHLEILAAFKVQPELRQTWTQEFLSSVRSSPPVYFLIETLEHQSFRIASDKQSLIQEFPEIWQFITANYIPETRIGFVECWRIKTEFAKREEMKGD